MSKKITYDYKSTGLYTKLKRDATKLVKLANKANKSKKFIVRKTGGGYYSVVRRIKHVRRRR